VAYYSCDSHVVEPAEVFEGLEGRFGTLAPQVLTNDGGDKAAVLLGGVRVPVGRFGIAGHRLELLDEEIAKLQRAREMLALALNCRYDHPATDCAMMAAEIDRRLDGQAG